MTNNKKFIFKPWNLIIIILIPVIIILVSDSVNTLSGIHNRYFFILGMIASLFGVSHFLKILITYIKSSKWNTAEAVIIENKVNKIDDAESIMYEPGIKYKYSVGTAEYCSNKIYPYDNFNTSTIKSYTSKLVKKYPAGIIFKRSYNPLKPQESYIERKGIFPIIVFLLMFGLNFVIMMLAALGIITLQ
jgi:hypothetical protein